MSNRTHIGEEFSKTINLTLTDIAKGAKTLGDTNPIHFCDKQAKKAGYTGIIASGAHTSGLCGGVLTQKFQDSGTFMGLDCSYKFHKAVMPNEQLIIIWKTASLEYKSSLNGSIASFTGKMLDSKNKPLITARMKVLLRDE